MENNNQLVSSPPPPSPSPPSSSASSFAAELFGDNHSQTSSGIFASIFPPPSTVARYPNRGTSAENVAKNTANANGGVMNMDRRSIFQERIEPCPLSSSLYYGGQEDMYIRSGDLTSKSYMKFKKEDAKEDPNHLHSATRGNWWQGSLYY